MTRRAGVPRCRWGRLFGRRGGRLFHRQGRRRDSLFHRQGRRRDSLFHRQGRRRYCETGHTLVELLISMAVMTTVAGGLVQLAAGGNSGFRTQPEFADTQQRLRVAADQIYRHLLTAGAGSDGTLAPHLPAVMPGRRGLRDADPELSSAGNSITIISSARGRTRTGLATDQSANTDAVIVETGRPPCPGAAPCGFTEGMRAMIFDSAGAGAGFDLFTVTGTTTTALLHGSPNPLFSRAYVRPSAQVMEVEQHIYFHDASTSRLIHDDGYLGQFPIVDHVVGLQFTYFADPDPASAPSPPAGGSSCLWAAGTPPVPLLAHLGGEAQRPLTTAQLTDGPVCGLRPNRFDGDLLRVRTVRVHLRVQAASESARRLLPDFAVTFDVAPRNLNLSR